MDFVPTLPVLGAYLAAVLVITFPPGPDMTLFLGKAVTQGRAAGPASYRPAPMRTPSHDAAAGSRRGVADGSRVTEVSAQANGGTTSPPLWLS